jgi:hypothetical protein
MREERKLRMFKNRLLRRKFGPKRDEIKEVWRKLHNEELHDLYSSSTILRVMKSRTHELGGACSSNEKGEACTGFWWRNLRRKRPLGRQRSRLEDNIKMDPQEVGYGGMDWIQLAQDRDRWRTPVNAVTNLRVP